MWNRIARAASAVALLAGAAVAQPATDRGGTTLQTPQGAVPSEPAVGAGAQSQVMTIPPPEELIGEWIASSDGVRLGKIVDVVSGEGLPDLVVISTAPESGGGKEIAVEMSRVQVRSDSMELHVADLTQAAVEAMPPFEIRDGMTALGRGKGGAEPDPR